MWNREVSMDAYGNFEFEIITRAEGQWNDFEGVENRYLNDDRISVNFRYSGSHIVIFVHL
jgi:hypothetical protein